MRIVAMMCQLHRVRVFVCAACSVCWSLVSEEGSKQTVGSLAVPLTPPWRSSRTWRWERSAAPLGDPGVTECPPVACSPLSVLARLCAPSLSLSPMSHCGIHRVSPAQLTDPQCVSHTNCRYAREMKPGRGHTAATVTRKQFHAVHATLTTAR